MLSIVLSQMLALAANDIATANESALFGKIAQARDFARDSGDALWPGYGKAPFEFLLVGPDHETLLCRQDVPAGFVGAANDPATGCATQTRARSGLPDTFLAAMPLFGPPATIVMGTPESTGRAPAQWLRTILHEHFHQWQFALPDYYQRINALGLHGADDDGGMWVLNYPFPYDQPAAGEGYARASQALADALDQRGKSGFGKAFRRFLAARQGFANTVPDSDWRYLEFESWQEGGARWAEFTFGMAYPDQDVHASAQALERDTLAQLRRPDLAKQRRELVYAFGAGQILLLEACDRHWRQRYPSLLTLAPLLEEAAKTCR